MISVDAKRSVQQFEVVKAVVVDDAAGKPDRAAIALHKQRAQELIADADKVGDSFGARPGIWFYGYGVGIVRVAISVAAYIDRTFALLDEWQDKWQNSKGTKNEGSVLTYFNARPNMVKSRLTPSK